jgi:hypothetical protein
MSKLQNYISEKNIKNLTIFSGIILFIGYCLNFYGLMKIYQVVESCNSKSCDASLNGPEAIIRVGSGLIYVGVGLVALIGILIAIYYLRIKQKPAPKAQPVTTPGAVKPKKATKKKTPTK